MSPRPPRCFATMQVRLLCFLFTTVCFYQAVPVQKNRTTALAYINSEGRHQEGLDQDELLSSAASEAAPRRWGGLRSISRLPAKLHLAVSTRRRVGSGASPDIQLDSPKRTEEGAGGRGEEIYRPKGCRFLHSIGSGSGECGDVCLSGAAATLSERFGGMTPGRCTVS